MESTTNSTVDSKASSNPPSFSVSVTTDGQRSGITTFGSTRLDSLDGPINHQLLQQILVGHRQSYLTPSQMFAQMAPQHTQGNPNIRYRNNTLSMSSEARKSTLLSPFDVSTAMNSVHSSDKSGSIHSLHSEHSQHSVHSESVSTQRSGHSHLGTDHFQMETVHEIPLQSDVEDADAVELTFIDHHHDHNDGDKDEEHSNSINDGRNEISIAVEEQEEEFYDLNENITPKTTP